LYYDPLLAKLIVWGRDRTQALSRLRRALAEYQVIGVRTTLPFARWLVEHPRFIAGDMSTDFVAEEWPPAPSLVGTPGAEQYAAPPLLPEQVAGMVGALLLQELQEGELRRQPLAVGEEASRWRIAGRQELARRW
jgi:acetyl/propionyl-CoA carboxylase alpha subunit